jgi:hypothetical protein
VSNFQLRIVPEGFGRRGAGQPGRSISRSSRFVASTTLRPMVRPVRPLAGSFANPLFDAVQIDPTEWWDSRWINGCSSSTANTSSP